MNQFLVMKYTSCKTKQNKDISNYIAELKYQSKNVFIRFK